MSIPRRIPRRVTNLVPIDTAVWQLPKTFEFVTPYPPNAPWGIDGRLGFSLCPFPDESADVNQSWCQSVLPFDSYPRLVNVWPLNPPPPSAPCVSRGNLFCVCPFPDRSADVCQIWCQSVQAVWQLPNTLNLWPPNPPPQCPLGELRGDLYLAYVHSQMNPQTWTSWCQSDSFPRLLNCWPPKTPKCPLVSRGAICLAYIHSHIN